LILVRWKYRNCTIINHLFPLFPILPRVRVKNHPKGWFLSNLITYLVLS
jgi:hypothetical protein